MQSHENKALKCADKDEWNGFIQMPALTHRDVFEGMEIFNCGSAAGLNFETTLFPEANWPVRFGKRMELYMEGWLRQNRHFEVVSAGLQIKESGITLGELDYVLLDRDKKQIIHLELAVKFYLFDAAHPKQWIGPNRNDSLVDKANKLKERQFPLWHHPAAQQTLRSFNLPEWPVSQQLCFKAMLFTPFDDDFTINPEINPLAVAGKWLTLLQFQEHRENEFYVPPKYQWANDPQTSHQWMPFDAASDLIKSLLMKKQSPLVWYRTPDGQTGRIFVVWW